MSNPGEYEIEILYWKELDGLCMNGRKVGMCSHALCEKPQERMPVARKGNERKGNILIGNVDGLRSGMHE